MKILKKIALRIALSKGERALIWRAIMYSAYKYKNRGGRNNQSAAAVMLGVKDLFGIADDAASGTSGDDILKNFAEATAVAEEKRLKAEFTKGYRHGIRHMLENYACTRRDAPGTEGLKPGDIVELAVEGDEGRSSDEGTTAAGKSGSGAAQDE